VLVLGHADVSRLLPIGECIDVMRDTFRKMAKGEVFQPLRSHIQPWDAKGLLGTMPAYRSGNPSAYAVKVISVFPDNPSRGMESHLGAVLLFSAETGELQCMANAAAITAIRTAAVSALATDLLARRDAGDLAIVGAGVQARAHIESISCVRRLARVRIAGRSAQRVRDLVSWARGYVTCPVGAVGTVEDAIRDSDLIVTVTNAHDPVLRRDWISDGAHINAVGSSVRTQREIDGATMAAARLFVDRRESTLNESGDYLMAVAEGSITRDHIVAELADVLIGASPGRRSDGEITLFESLGLAVEDLAAVEHVARKAAEQNAGTLTRWPVPGRPRTSTLCARGSSRCRSPGRTSITRHSARSRGRTSRAPLAASKR
jgi:ornithine cyclodeaminase